MSNNAPSLTATYSSPTNPSFTISKPLPSTSDSSTSSSSSEVKTAYLAALRDAVTQTQADVNKELTARMEDDKARAGGSGANKGGVDEDKEEENYGEEVQEEED